MLFRLLASAGALSLGLTASGAALADMGPKPTMEFAFSLENNLTIKTGTLFLCRDDKCSDPHPLVPRGPERFSCNDRGCGAMAYGFDAFARIEISFSDGRTLKSNVFSSRDFHGKYRVSVGAAALTVQPEA